MAQGRNPQRASRAVIPATCLGVACVMALAWPSARGLDADVAPGCQGEASRELALALSRALAIADRSIATAAVDKLITLAGDEHPGYLVAHEESDGLGRWYLQRMTSGVWPETKLPAVFDDTSVCDGEFAWGWVASEGGGTVRDPLGRFRPYYPFGMLAGSMEDGFGLEGVGELLLRSPDLRMDFSGEGGRPRVIGQALLPPRVVTLRVTVDPEHGFLPSCVETLDYLLNSVVERTTIETFEEHDGVWIPVRGWRRQRVPEWSDEDRGRFFRRLRELGFEGRPDPLDEKEVLAHRRAIREVFGGDEISSRDDFPQGVRRLEFSIRALNAPLDPTRHFAGWPVDYRVYDEFRHAMKERGSMEWHGEKPAGEGR